MKCQEEFCDFGERNCGSLLNYILKLPVANVNSIMRISKRPQPEATVLFLSKRKPLGTTAQFILFSFSHHLNTRSYFMRLLPLNGRRRLRSNIVHNAVNARNFVHNTR